MTTAQNRSSTLYWRYQLGFWFCYWVINLIYARAFGFSSLFYDGMFLLISVAMLGVTHALRGLYLHSAQTKSLGFLCLHLLWILPVLAILLQAAVRVCTYWYLFYFQANNPGGAVLGNKNAFIGYVISTIFILVLWCIICLLRREWVRSQHVEREQWQNQLKLRDLELQFLRSQINSHFLFNALNNIRSVILEDTQVARQAINDLATLLRGVLHNEARATLSVAEELELVKGYLTLEKLQFEKRLSFAMNIDPHLHVAQLPPLLLQTLVENAIKHGIARRAQGGVIQITAATLPNQRWFIQVENPLAELPANDASSGIGLKNARSRLQAAFGEHASLEVTQTATVVARVEMPMKTNTK